ncbi:MAG: acetyl-CoA carboxylase biotin carboxyl carrier protein [Pseudomonadota bacterium]
MKDLKHVKTLIEWLEASSLDEIEFQQGDVSIRVARHAAATTTHVHSDSLSTTAHVLHAKNSTGAETKQTFSSGTVVRSPMVGTFYSSPAPEAPAFVNVGSSVKTGDPLCIIEAMKMMNPIEAPTSGKIIEILVSNGAPIEFEQPLFVID